MGKSSRLKWYAFRCDSVHRTVGYFLLWVWYVIPKYFQAGWSSINAINELNHSRAFYRHLLAIAGPIFLQNLMGSSLNFLDTFMIGSVGEVELASVAMANQLFFLFLMLSIAVCSGCGVLVAQLWGSGDRATPRTVLAVCMSLNVVIALLFTVAGMVMPERVIALFNDDPRVVAVGSGYLRISVLSYAFAAVTFAAAAGFRSIKRTRVPMVANLVGIVVNATLNWVLIFGKLGFPALGATGAAIATLIARVIECGIIMSALYRGDRALGFSLPDLRGTTRRLVRRLADLILPMTMNQIAWGLGNVTYIAIYARIGTGASAAFQVCSTIMQLFLIMFFGLSNATRVIVGHEVGAGRPDAAKQAAARVVRLATLLAVLMSGVLLLLARPISGLFNVSEEVTYASVRMLRIFSAVLVFRVFNNVMILGAFWGGGDASYGSVLQGLALWLIRIPVAYVVALVLGLPSFVVVTALGFEELTKTFFTVARFRSGKWIRNLPAE